MTDKELLDSWNKLLQEIGMKLNTIEEEKRIANYPISQQTENWMYVTRQSLNYFINSIEEDLEELK